MNPFTYERAADGQGAIIAVSRTGAKFISGGTNLLDLMKLGIEQPTHLVDISRLPLKEIQEMPGRRPAHRRSSAEFGSGRRPPSPSSLSGPLPGAPRWRLRSIAQQGIRGRQPAAAHTVPVFLRHGRALQQTRTRDRLLRDWRLQPGTRDPRCNRRVHRHTSLRHGGSDGGARGRGRTARR